MLAESVLGDLSGLDPPAVGADIERVVGLPADSECPAHEPAAIALATAPRRRGRRVHPSLSQAVADRLSPGEAGPCEEVISIHEAKGNGWGFLGEARRLILRIRAPNSKSVNGQVSGTANIKSFEKSWARTRAPGAKWSENCSRMPGRIRIESAVAAHPPRSRSTRPVLKWRRRCRSPGDSLSLRTPTARQRDGNGGGEAYLRSGAGAGASSATGCKPVPLGQIV